MPDPVEAWMPGSPGRWPFAGHVRGRWEQGPVRLAWAGRVANSAPPEEAWLAAEALRGVLAGVKGDGRFHAIATAWAALASLPSTLLARNDLSVLFAASDPAGIVLSGAGLSAVYVEAPHGWVAAALSGSPLFVEPGLPGTPPVPQPSLRPGVRFVGVPEGLSLPPADRLALACGVRA